MRHFFCVLLAAVCITLTCAFKGNAAAEEADQTAHLALQAEATPGEQYSTPLGTFAGASRVQEGRIKVRTAAGSVGTGEETKVFYAYSQVNAGYGELLLGVCFETGGPIDAEFVFDDCNITIGANKYAPIAYATGDGADYAEGVAPGMTLHLERAGRTYLYFRVPALTEGYMFFYDRACLEFRISGIEPAEAEKAASLLEGTPQAPRALPLSPPQGGSKSATPVRQSLEARSGNEPAAARLQTSRQRRIAAIDAYISAVLKSSGVVLKCSGSSPNMALMIPFVAELDSLYEEIPLSKPMDYLTAMFRRHPRNILCLELKRGAYTAKLLEDRLGPPDSSEMAPSRPVRWLIYGYMRCTELPETGEILSIEIDTQSFLSAHGISATAAATDSQRQEPRRHNAPTSRFTLHTLSDVQSSRYGSGPPFVMKTGNLYDSQTHTLLITDAMSKKLREAVAKLNLSSAQDRQRALDEFVDILGETRARKIGIVIFDARGNARYVWPFP